MRGGYYAPTINIRLKCPKIDHTENYELFTLIDTGADCTVIMPSGAEILGIDEYELENIRGKESSGPIIEFHDIFGCDFLTHNGANLFFSPHKRSAYLEVE